MHANGAAELAPAESTSALQRKFFFSSSVCFLAGGEFAAGGFDWRTRRTSGESIGSPKASKQTSSFGEEEEVLSDDRHSAVRRTLRTLKDLAGSLRVVSSGVFFTLAGKCTVILTGSRLALCRVSISPVGLVAPHLQPFSLPPAEKRLGGFLDFRRPQFGWLASRRRPHPLPLWTLSRRSHQKSRRPAAAVVAAMTYYCTVLRRLRIRYTSVVAEA